MPSTSFCQSPVPSLSLPPSHHHPKHVSSLTTCQSPVPSPSPPPACHHNNQHFSSPAPSHSHPGHISSLTTPSCCPSGCISTSTSASWLDAYMEAADESPTPTGPVHVYRSQNEDQGDDQDQDQSYQTDQSVDFNTGDDKEKFDNLKSEDHSNELESEDGSGGSEDIGKRADHCSLKKHKVSGMKHGAKGKGSTAKDMDEHLDEDDPEDTVERVSGHKPGKQVGPKQHKVDGKKSAKGKGARGQATKGQSTKSKARPPTHHSTHKK